MTVNDGCGVKSIPPVTPVTVIDQYVDGVVAGAAFDPGERRRVAADRQGVVAAIAVQPDRAAVAVGVDVVGVAGAVNVLDVPEADQATGRLAAAGQAGQDGDLIVVRCVVVGHELDVHDREGVVVFAEPEDSGFHRVDAKTAVDGRRTPPLRQDGDQVVAVVELVQDVAAHVEQAVVAATGGDLIKVAQVDAAPPPPVQAVHRHVVAGVELDAVDTRYLGIVQLLTEAVRVVRNGEVQAQGVEATHAVGKIRILDLVHRGGDERVITQRTDQVVGVGREQQLADDHDARRTRVEVGNTVLRLGDQRAVDVHRDVAVALDAHVVGRVGYRRIQLDVQRAAGRDVRIDVDHQRGGAGGLVDHAVVQIDHPRLRVVAGGHQLDELQTGDVAQVGGGDGGFVDDPQRVLDGVREGRIGAVVEHHHAVDRVVVGDDDVADGATQQRERILWRGDVLDVDGVRATDGGLEPDRQAGVAGEVHRDVIQGEELFQRPGVAHGLNVQVGVPVGLDYLVLHQGHALGDQRLRDDRVDRGQQRNHDAVGQLRRHGDVVVGGGLDQVVGQVQADVGIAQVEGLETAGLARLGVGHATVARETAKVGQDQGIVAVIAGDEVFAGQILRPQPDGVVAGTQVRVQQVVLIDPNEVVAVAAQDGGDQVVVAFAVDQQAVVAGAQVDGVDAVADDLDAVVAGTAGGVDVTVAVNAQEVVAVAQGDGLAAVAVNLDSVVAAAGIDGVGAVAVNAQEVVAVAQVDSVVAVAFNLDSVIAGAGEDGVVAVAVHAQAVVAGTQVEVVAAVDVTAGEGSRAVVGDEVVAVAGDHPVIHGAGDDDVVAGTAVDRGFAGAGAHPVVAGAQRDILVVAGVAEVDVVVTLRADVGNLVDAAHAVVGLGHVQRQVGDQRAGVDAADVLVERVLHRQVGIAGDVDGFERGADVQLADHVGRGRGDLIFVAIQRGDVDLIDFGTAEALADVAEVDCGAADFLQLDFDRAGARVGVGVVGEVVGFVGVDDADVRAFDALDVTEGERRAFGLDRLDGGHALGVGHIERAGADGQRLDADGLHAAAVEAGQGNAGAADGDLERIVAVAAVDFVTQLQGVLRGLEGVVADRSRQVVGAGGESVGQADRGGRGVIDVDRTGHTINGHAQRLEAFGGGVRDQGPLDNRLALGVDDDRSGQ
nr:H489 [uncultured bacterium]